MAHSKRQDITIGNGSTKPILAQGNAPTVGRSKPYPASTSIGEGSTKPVSIPEALSLLQTLCLDLRSMGCEVSILARGQMMYMITKIPASIGMLEKSDTGHILLDGVPVSFYSEATK